jgi:hypothetical protein
VRGLALATGAGLIVVALAAGSRVADTREGLISEIVALLAGLAGISLVLYGWASRARPQRDKASPPTGSPGAQVRSATELLVGGAGLVVAAGLVAGIGVSAGALWAVMGFALLLPMMLGCAYLCIRFLRAPTREWTIDLRRLRGK